MTKLPFKGKGERSTDTLNLIHSGVYGSMSVLIHDDFSYFITFIMTLMMWVFVPYEAQIRILERFKELKNEVEKQLNKSIEAFQLDRDGKYLKSSVSKLSAR